jgi:hypothetical protein
VDAEREVLSLAMGDFGWRTVRGRGDVAGSDRVTLLGESKDLTALVSRIDGLKASLVGKKLSAALERFENKTGSTFSKSSLSIRSEAFLFAPSAGGIAANLLASNVFACVGRWQGVAQ